MSWFYLIVASLFEMAWPVGLKLAQLDDRRALGIGIALAGMTLSGVFLYLAQREIAIGTAYAVWTGIGAAGTFFIGLLFFGDAASLGRYLGVLLIIMGVVALKLSP